MKDFNDANHKIDAKFLAAQQERTTLAQRIGKLEQKEPCIKLREIITSTAASQVDLDLSNIAFCNYQAVHLDMALREASGSSVYVCVNGDRNGSSVISLYSNNGQFYSSTLSAITTLALQGDITYHPMFPRVSILVRKDDINYVVSHTLWICNSERILLRYYLAACRR